VGINSQGAVSPALNSGVVSMVYPDSFGLSLPLHCFCVTG